MCHFGGKKREVYIKNRMMQFCAVHLQFFLQKLKGLLLMPYVPVGIKETKKKKKKGL